MPRIHPQTGCTVMTFHEAIAHEAQHRGIQPEEVLEEIHQAFEDDRRDQIAYLRRDALQIIQKAARQDRDAWLKDCELNGQRFPETRQVEDGRIETVMEPFDAGPEPPYPVELLEILDVDCSTTFRSSTGRILARVRCDDAKIRLADFWWGSDSGSWDEPPDHDEALTWSDDGEAPAEIPGSASSR